MKDFLKHNWLWIALPFFAVLGLVLYLVLGAQDAAPPGTYGQ